MHGKVDEKKISIPMILLLIIAIPILIFNVTIIYKANRYPDKVPDFMGYKPFAVLSGSMQSNIMKGDLVVVKEIDPTTLEVNDIIAFRDEDGYVVTHRIIDIVEQNGEKYFVTKGDNNNVQDDLLVSLSSVEGIYSFKISGLGNFIIFIQEPMGFCIFMMSLFIIGVLFISLMNAKDDQKFKKENAEYIKEFEEFKRKKRTTE